MQRHRIGFTLIELLIVVAIIAILAAIAVPNFLEAQTRAKISRMKSDMRTLSTGIETYAIDHTAYPLYGRITMGNSVEPIALGVGGQASPDKNEFPTVNFTTPVAYLNTRLSDIFATGLEGPEPFTAYVNYISMAYHFSLPGAPPLPVQQDLLEKTGRWRTISCGPDRDRGADTKFKNLVYDPSNGTVSDGDIVRTQRNPDSVAR